MSIQYPYGAVYFRKSNPPQVDWENDYATASEDGMNVFRHWFMWNAIEIAPGKFDWQDYDSQMDLAERFGIKVIIAEMMTSVPEWIFSRYGDYLYERADKAPLVSQISGSSATGGFAEGSAGALCLDHEQSKELAGRFLTELAERYKDHPAMLGYDVWNECNYTPAICHCPATQQVFRDWLRNKYHHIQNLNQAWHRYSYTDWNDVFSPRKMGPYAECIDWQAFRKENFYQHMQWRIDLIRAVDDKNLITAHGTAASISNMATGGSDDWLAASKVDIYGFTWVASRKGSEPWKQWHAVDLVRSAAADKPFWHAEAQGGPLWLQPQVTGRPKEDGRVTTAAQLRLWNMISIAGGAKGLLYPRWRPLLDGPLFGAFGPYAMDGSRTARSKMASTIARWLNDPAQNELVNARPVKGDIGLLVAPESQVFSHLLSQDSCYDGYARALWGAYRGFFDQGLQADWVRFEDISSYSVLYLAFPIMLEELHIQKLIDWTKAGGYLICEGCPGYFDASGHVSALQPPSGLEQLFGARQEDVEFMPDQSDLIRFEYDEIEGFMSGAGFRQTYQLIDGIARGRYSDGSIAVVENDYGEGKTLLLGTFLSEAYYCSEGQANSSMYHELISWAHINQKLTLSNQRVQARLHQYKMKYFLWLINPTEQEQHVIVSFNAALGLSATGKVLWGANNGKLDDQNLQADIPPCDALVIELV